MWHVFAARDRSLRASQGGRHINLCTTHARLCHASRGELEQIQFLLEHYSTSEPDLHYHVRFLVGGYVFPITWSRICDRPQVRSPDRGPSRRIQRSQEELHEISLKISNSIVGEDQYLFGARPCTPAWQAVQSVIRFSSASSPEWLRNCLWWASRFDMVPQD
jgi:hypothetical protein